MKARLKRIIKKYLTKKVKPTKCYTFREIVSPSHKIIGATEHTSIIEAKNDREAYEKAYIHYELARLMRLDLINKVIPPHQKMFAKTLHFELLEGDREVKVFLNYFTKQRCRDHAKKAVESLK